MPTATALLREISLFQSMDDHELAAIAELMDETGFEAGRQIFHERD